MIHDLARRESPLNSLFELINVFEEQPRRTLNQSRLKTDLAETDSGYVAKFDVPGLRRDNIDINFENRVLTINVKHDDEKCCEEGRYRVRERRVEQASRSFHLPDANSESIIANLENGVLTVRADKNKEAQTRKIDIK